mmetsp:Transcript_25831/g.57909  ORF Transcript_25831/g.57909 Transcript_25831/m.57909 type:complete len:162 (-) Transcript_25831:466-951(-)
MADQSGPHGLSSKVIPDFPRWSPSSASRMLSSNHRGSVPDLLVIFLATLVGMFAMLVSLLIYRHCLKKREYAYTLVHHGLDPEEEEFKKALESQSDEIDELFNFSTDVEDSADLEFDASELDQIEMLENYRSNLAAGANRPDGLPPPKIDAPPLPADPNFN